MAKYNIETFSADDATGLIRENVEAVQNLSFTPEELETIEQALR